VRTACTQCPLSTYADIEGSTACTACAANMETLWTGASYGSDCICMEGTTRAGWENGSLWNNRSASADSVSETPAVCVSCTKGLACDGRGVIAPTVLPGFWTDGRIRVDDGGGAFLLAWKCEAASQRCHGGNISEQCNPLYAGIFCAECPEGSFMLAERTPSLASVAGRTLFCGRWLYACG
jgi:hypothetical protein